MYTPLPIPIGPQELLGKWFRCYSCTNAYRLDVSFACTDCKAPYDKEKLAEAKIRNEKPYPARLSVSENKIRRMNRTGYMKGSWTDTVKNITIYLNKSGAERPTFNGMDMWEIQAKRSYYPKKKDRTD